MGLEGATCPGGLIWGHSEHVQAALLMSHEGPGTGPTSEAQSRGGGAGSSWYMAPA